jgi:hypothetical protein
MKLLTSLLSLLALLLYHTATGSYYVLEILPNAPITNVRPLAPFPICLPH